jgi:hypothetical protein
MEREPAHEPGDGVTVEEGVNDPLPPADEIDQDEDAETTE